MLSIVRIKGRKRDCWLFCSRSMALCENLLNFWRPCLIIVLLCNILTQIYFQSFFPYFSIFIVAMLSEVTHKRIGMHQTSRSFSAFRFWASIWYQMKKKTWKNPQNKQIKINTSLTPGTISMNKTDLNRFQEEIQRGRRFSKTWPADHSMDGYICMLMPCQWQMIKSLLHKHIELLAYS